MSRKALMRGAGAVLPVWTTASASLRTWSFPCWPSHTSSIWNSGGGPAYFSQPCGDAKGHSSLEDAGWEDECWLPPPRPAALPNLQFLICEMATPLPLALRCRVRECASRSPAPRPDSAPSVTPPKPSGVVPGARSLTRSCWRPSWETGTPVTAAVQSAAISRQ